MHFSRAKERVARDPQNPAKEIIMRKVLTLTLSAALGLSTVALIGCEKSESEKAKDTQQEQVKQAGKEVENAGEKMQDAAKNAGEAGTAATQKAGEAANQAINAAKEGANSAGATTKPTTP
jgi:hypothetical protein